MESKEAEAEEVKTSLFPLFAASSATAHHQATASSTSVVTAPSQWLSNTSFTTDLSVINDAVSSLQNHPEASSSSEDDESDQRKPPAQSLTSYELVKDDYEDKDGQDGEYRRRVSDTDSDSDRERKKKKRKRRKHEKKRKRSQDEDRGGGNDFGSRKSNVRVWADSITKPPKDYYFDTHGDGDNLVYGSLYRMDVPRYKPYNPLKPSGIGFGGMFSLKRGSSGFDRDVDIDALDSEIKSAGRYWSPKYAAVERHKNLKRVRVLMRKPSAVVRSDDFIPLIEDEKVGEGVDMSGLPSTAAMVEESWEDEVLRRTREFNTLTREHPHDEKVWLEFAQFQDRVASMQPQKGARLQTLEKKISILEKAAELNPDNEDLLLCLLKAYQSRDSTDVLIGRWERVLIHHSGSCKLWKEYLRVVQGEFSRFKVSDIRKMYAHAIEALSTACSKQSRQVYEQLSTVDHSVVQLELGLVDIFLSLCWFEWQAGYKELATALLQAEIEYSVFCPPLHITDRGKLRLFEYFWNGGGPRVGEEGALGWSTWLEKEEENRQRIMKEETAQDEEKGGWTGWSEPISKYNETSKDLENVTNDDMPFEDFQEEIDNEEIKQEDDTEALLKQLGIAVDAEADSEVKDSSTWSRWSEEESLRDCNQWLPVRGKSDPISQIDQSTDREDDGNLLGVILFEDVSEYLFSLCSREARLSLLSQFVEFFGGEMSQWICTNSSSWSEKILSLDVLPNSISRTLRSVDDILAKLESSSSCNRSEFLVGISSDRRMDVMKFLRNAILLCLTAFPRNHLLEEAALVAEEFSVVKLDSSTPCRALAKSLLKNDRQDMLLCGVYARREAVFGNISYARRVFDMALTSAEGLPADLRSSVPLLYFWYAETELANGIDKTQESYSRALHVLSCLGNGAEYTPFESKPSSLHLLRAHQGFKEKLKAARSAWTRGVVDDQSIALICSAALFEELTNGWAAAIEVLDQAFNMVLPERRSQSYHLEFLSNYYVRILLRHSKQSTLSNIWESILKGLQIYPSSSELYKNLVEISLLYTTPNKLRLLFDDLCHKKPSVVVWLFALSFEMSRGSSRHRIHGLFERALADETLCKSVILWRMYIAYQIDIAGDPSAARRIFFRAIHACPWSKRLWLDGFSKLNSILSPKELSDLQEVMQDKELNLRTDIYEILLQEES